MNKHFDGGTAFPRLTYQPFGAGSGQWHNEGGMSLRDHFAGLAMQGLLISYPRMSIAETAGAAQSMADAMLKALGEVKP